MTRQPIIGSELGIHVRAQGFEVPLHSVQMTVDPSPLQQSSYTQCVGDSQGAGWWNGLFPWLM